MAHVIILQLANLAQEVRLVRVALYSALCLTLVPKSDIDKVLVENESEQEGRFHKCVLFARQDSQISGVESSFELQESCETRLLLDTWGLQGCLVKYFTVGKELQGVWSSPEIQAVSGAQ